MGMGWDDDHDSILISGNFADITIKCDGYEFNVHSTILSARSDFFSAACRPMEGNDPTPNSAGTN